MIRKERLEELVKKGAMIYEAKYGNINPVDFSKNKVRWFGKNCITLEPSLVERYGNHKYYKNLFETKEEAEEYAEFGNITRPERLDLPTFDELFDEIFAGSFGIHTIQRFDNVQIRYKLLLSGVAWLFVVKGKDELFTAQLSRENYNEARRLCVKLFKGEKV